MMTFWHRNADLVTDAQRHLYHLEAVHNFRWVNTLNIAKKSPHILSAADFAPDHLPPVLSDLGQFAELVHGFIPPLVVWRNITLLSRPNFPLESYTAVHSSHLLSHFHGAADVQGFVVYRPENKQLVLAFSATATFLQFLNDLDARQVHYPAASPAGAPDGRCKVHAGFWRLYNGVKALALDALKKALAQRDTCEIAITAHSLGAPLSYFLVLDLLHMNAQSAGGTPALINLTGLPLTLALFGAPRAANASMVQFYRRTVANYRKEHGEHSFKQYSVKAHNDGVPALPPATLGFRHFDPTPLYLHHGRLYQIPPSASEYSRFDVVHDEPDYTPATPAHPRGGHNYYNGRNMERLSRRMQWVTNHAARASGALEDGWEEAYMRRVAAEKRKLEGGSAIGRALWGKP